MLYQQQYKNRVNWENTKTVNTVITTKIHLDSKNILGHKILGLEFSHKISLKIFPSQKFSFHSSKILLLLTMADNFE